MSLEQHTNGQDSGEGENYFVSMTDMMVGMLFIFIILLMSFALLFRHQTDEQVRTTETQKGKIEVAEEVGRRLDELESRITQRLNEAREANQLRSRLLRELEAQLLREQLVVQVDESSGVLRLTEDAVRFPVNGWVLAGRAKDNVSKIARVLASILPAYAVCAKTESTPQCREEKRSSLETVFVEGHTDETGIDEQNWRLSTLRAASTYRGLTEVSPEIRNIHNSRDEEILSIAGYSSTRPIDTGGNAAAREKNRRIDLRFVMDTDTTAGLSEINTLLRNMRAAIQELKGAPR
jgi:chemotaxis protein MotB